MKPLLFSLLFATASAFAVELNGDFKGPLGLQLYSLRDSLKTLRTRDLGLSSLNTGR